MDQPQTSLKPRILLAPLDWGLGHATRDIPIVQELLNQNADVLIAGDGKVRSLLEKEFPQLEFIHLAGYDISYSKSKWTLPFTLAAQVPKLISAIEKEKEAIDDIVKKYRIDAIISDNRFGLSHEKIPSIFITHQLLIKTNLGKKADELLQKLNYHYINQYNACWVPDLQEDNNLAGELSHPTKLPSIETVYLGPLSRMKLKEETKDDYLLVLLSGPEPQRTLLEEMLTGQLRNYKEQVVLVRGFPGDKKPIDVSPNITVHDHLPAKELNRLMLQATMIISRCGYSTVMDIAALKKKSILIPTPGQTEQEYLARHLMQKNFAFCIEQHKFRLKPVLDLASGFNYKPFINTAENSLAMAVERLLNQVRKNKD